MRSLSVQVGICAAFLATLLPLVCAGGPFLKILNETHSVIGNDHWNMTHGIILGKELWYKGKDRVGEAWGHYVSYNGAASNLNFSLPSIVSSSSFTISSEPALTIRYPSPDGSLYWILTPSLHGAYQYFTNTALPSLGEFRTLWRLDNNSFTHGYTSERDGKLPELREYMPDVAVKVQDETWERLGEQGGGKGEFVTKYDWSAYIREQEVYGVYGEEVGSWYVVPGRDEYNGDQMKQELMIHRESATGDTVQLNMLHGTHFQASAVDDFAVNKTWGPWLWYLNSSPSHNATELKLDAHARAAREFDSWPYSWFNSPEPSSNYHTRGTVSGRLQLADGRAAGGTAVFLGDNRPNKTSLDMGSGNYYTGYADSEGYFSFDNVREGVYALQAWADGGEIGDVAGKYVLDDVAVAKGQETALGEIVWTPRYDPAEEIWRIGDFDRKALGFQYGGTPYTHGVVEQCPNNTDFTVGVSTTVEWCFAQGGLGSWNIHFELAEEDLRMRNQTSLLTVSLAGYSAGASSSIYVNANTKVGNLTSGGGSRTNFTESLANDQSVYRSATTAGEWRHFEFILGAGLFVEGWNTVEFRVETSSRWRGFMWDAISLAWL